MTANALQINRLHCSSVYSAFKAEELAAQLNQDERADESNYDARGHFIGYVYAADIKENFGRVAAYHQNEFVGYF